VFNGPFESQGMPDFSGELSDSDVIKIIAFIQRTADATQSKK
jgi:quinohemoprotein ethanol dehydrogenase